MSLNLVKRLTKPAIHSDFMFDELKRFKAGEKLLYEVTIPMLETMA